MTGVAVLDWIIGAAVALAGAWGTWAMGRKALADARATRRSRDAPAPPSWPEMWQRMDAQEEETRRLRVDVDRLRANEGRLISWVSTLHRGIDNGTIPPLPPLPAWLEDMLRNHHR